MAWRCVLVSVGSAEGSEVGCVECRKEPLGFFYESFMYCIIEKEFIGSWWCFDPKITNMDIEDKLFKVLTLLTAVC